MPLVRAISSRMAGNFELLYRVLGLRVMARTGRQFAVAHGSQLPAHGLLGNPDPEFLPYPLAQINKPPAHETMDGSGRAALYHRRQCRTVRVAQPRRLAGRLAVDQPIGPLVVELHHPVTNDLQRHPANLRRVGSRPAVIDRGQGKKPARLRGILCPSCQRSQLTSVEISPEWDRHGETPSFATLTPINAASGKPQESGFQDLVLRLASMPSPVGSSRLPKKSSRILRGWHSAPRQLCGNRYRCA